MTWISENEKNDSGKKLVVNQGRMFPGEWEIQEIFFNPVSPHLLKLVRGQLLVASDTSHSSVSKINEAWK